jgi:GNAT superfamily N-acetyltransferase
MNMVRAYVACVTGSPEIIGFYYLNLSSIAVGYLDDVSDGKFERYKAVPVVYLGMIAVHDECAGCGLGKKLMAHAIARSAEIGNLAGMYALTLDALDESLVTYYAQFDFRPFKQGQTGLEMFLPITTIRAAIKESSQAEA